MIKYKLIFFLFLFVNLYSQEYLVKQYSISEGLAQSQVLSVAQNSDGVLWIGTNGGGISRYDGNRFYTLSVRDGLPDNSVYAITIDTKGNIWIGTSSGLAKFKNGKIITYQDQYGISRVNRIIKDQSGGIWIADNSKGLVHFDGSQFVFFDKKSGLPDNSVKDIFLSNDGTLWIATLNGVSKYDGKSFRNFSIKDGLLENYTSSVFVDNKGTVYCGHSNGFTIIKNSNEKLEFSKNRTNFLVHSFSYDKESNILLGTVKGLKKFHNNSIENISLISSIPVISIGSIFKDIEGNLWLGTDGNGVLKIRQTNFSNYTTDNGFIDDYAWTITQDPAGSIWVGTNTNGVIRIDGNNFKVYKTNQGLPSNQVFASLKDKKGNLLFGTSKGLSIYNGKGFKNYYNPFGFEENIILNMMEDSEGSFWFGTVSGVMKFDGNNFTRFSIGSNKKELGVFKIYQDNTGKIWFCTEHDGIFIYDKEVIKNFNPHEIFKESKVWAMTQDNKNNFWFGHWGKGLIMFSTIDSTLKFFSESDGLIENNIVSLKYDGKKFLWIGTNKGISRFDLEEFNNTGNTIIKNYGIYEGFTGIECNQNASFIDSKGNVWFGHAKGVTRFNSSSEKESINSVEPKLMLTNIKLFFSESDFSQYRTGIDSLTGIPYGLKLPYNKNYLQFSFVGVSLTSPEKVLYKYKLEGLDTSWTPPTNYTIANYTNLPPGEYKFMLLASNNDGIWTSEPLIYNFIITPPFWKTWWFILLTVLTIVSVIALIVKIRLDVIHKQNEIIRKSEERLSLVLLGSNDAPWDRDLVEDEIYYSPKWWSMIGYDENELKADTKLLKLLMHPEDILNFELILSDALENNKSSYEVEFRLKHKKGSYVPILSRGFIQRDLDNKPIRISGTNTDLTERKKAEIALRESEQKFRELSELLPQTVFEMDLHGKLTFVNKSAFEYFGYSEEEFENGLNAIDMIIPEDRERAFRSIKNILNKKEMSVNEYLALKKDGTTFPVIIFSNIILKGDLPSGIRGIIVDISDRKNLENQIKSSLKEKEILLKEVHHRVKNNFQVIMSLFNLQSNLIEDPDILNVFKESRNRIKSMALIHELLYKENNFYSIDIKYYTQKLVEFLKESYLDSNNNVTISLDAEDIRLDIDRIIPCGLIINELVSNSLKHAFPGVRSGEILISFKKIPEDFYSLSVRNNGVQLPEEFDINNLKSLGMLLVNTLTMQIQGELYINSTEEGTEFKITFRDNQ
ncbi:MAG: two-component regulator propeller domain-containing protein [Melioribacteraceae bacterium]|nr:two-component regulator propeller domain-containing protein [Melioribacteraceae bacterium]